ncbi:unnamed protein product [Medioppia subpectinata]|uniref:Guanylate-binding protein N-terminal domain-containing protein n=1 Tax=Medioppia subpectinata TaxID=1979941 RepID=A0A7R9KEU6_9ACAR|nr:unnamed protein product [Medioppia subpectinata]CAG2101035.1 unnamed protein product [Medioppia subpectinata]
MDPDADDSSNQYKIVPVQIITIERIEGTDQSKYILNKPALDRLLAKIGDLKLTLIFNVGTQGEGNSFLLNKVGRHIINSMRNGVPSGPADEQDVDYDMGADIEVLEDPDDPLVGFEWNTDPNETTTRGIWFSQPFIVRKTGGEELAIILVDTQGLGSDDCTPQDMSTIVGLSLLSASTLVFNVTNGLRDNVLTEMHSYIDHCLQAVENSTGSFGHPGNDRKHFQDLVLMIRDWSKPKPPYGYGLEGGQNFLNGRLETSARQRESARNTRQFIRESFGNIQCFLMPDPGVNARSQEFNGCPNELTNDFNANLKDFCNFLVNPDTIQVKTINGQPITGHEFGLYFENYVNMFNSESGPRVCDVVESNHRAYDNNLINQLKDKCTTELSAIMTGRPFLGRRQLTTQADDSINSLKSEFGFRKRSTAESVVRELTDQLSRTLHAVFEQKREENEMRRLTATNDKVTDLVNEFKQHICGHIRPGDYLSDHTLGKIIDTKRDHTINLFDAFAADDPDQFAEHKRRLLNQLESKENTFKSNNSRAIQELITQYESVLTLLKTQYDQRMNELFIEQDKFYTEEHLDTLSATILSSLVNELTQADVDTEVVPIVPYRQALDTYVRDRYRGYKENNRHRTDQDKSAMNTVLNNLNKLYEEALDAWIQCTDTEERRRFLDESRHIRTPLDAWIQCTDTEERRRFLDESRHIRTRIVSENMPIYSHRLDLLELNAMFDTTEREMQDVFVEAVDDRHRLMTTLADRAMKWYNREMTTEYGDRPYIRLDRLGTIHEALVAGALARFQNDRGHISMDTYNELIRDKLKLTYDRVIDENNRNCPTIPAIGIDLGTTNSCVAYYRPGRPGQPGKIVVCRTTNTTRTNEVTPSCVEYRDNKEVVVGEEAKDNLLANRQNIIYSAKRLIGRPFNDPDVTRYRQYWPFDVVDMGDGAAGVEVEVDGESRQLLPEEVSAEVLRKMKAIAERDLSHQVVDAVITVPAYFTDAQREATRGAGVMAGLNVLSIINEPTAAALAYKLDRFEDMGTKTVLIYDFGGGTFDVVILRLAIGEVKVLAVGGDNKLGGDDIDQNIIDHCLREFYAQTGVMLDRNSVEGDRAYRGLKDRCEREKWRLSEATAATIAVDNIADGHDLLVELTRTEFETLNMDIFDRTMDCVNRTLESVNEGAGMTPDEIDDIVLVGGSTYIPYVKDMIRRHFNGRQPSQSVNPMLAVAEGAALQAAILNGNQAHLHHHLRVLDVTPHTLGVKSRGDVMSAIIPAQSSVDGVPRTRVYATVCDNQTEIEVEVYEGEDPVATNNTPLGKFVVMNIPPDEAGKQNVSVQFCVNDDGILKLTATVLSRGAQGAVEYEVAEYKGRLSIEELFRRRH